MHEAENTRLRPRIASMLFACLLALSLGVIVAPAAQAACPENPSDALNTVGSPSGSSWLGVRVSGPGMDVFDGAVSCTRVSSLFVLNSTGTRWVEVGWYEDPSGGGADYACIPSTSGAPKILAFSYDNGSVDCKTNGVGLSEGTSGFYIQDQNTDGVWKFFKDGDQTWTSPDMTPFSSGWVASNGERNDFTNTSHAVFDGLNKMNDNGNWGDWNSTNEDSLSDDSQAHFCKYSDTHTQVKLNGTAC